MQRMEKKRELLLIITIIIVLIAVLLFAKRDTVRMVYHNLFKTEIPPDDPEEWDNGKTYLHVQYTDVSSSDYLDLYIPDSEKPMPLLVLVHGGGFLSGDSDSRQCRYMYQYFRDQGYACASVNYRLAEEAVFPAAIADVKAAIRYLRASAEQYGYDPDKIAIWGESAGGYLAAMAGLTDDKQFADVAFSGEEDLPESVSSEVSAIIDFYGVSELGEMDRDFDELGIPGIVTSLGKSWMWKDMQGTGYSSFEEVWLDKHVKDLTEEELNETSPGWYAFKNLDENSKLRVLLWHGDADITVPCLQSERLYETLTMLLGEKQVTYQLFPNYIHADDLFYSDSMLEEVKKFLDETFAVL